MPQFDVQQFEIHIRQSFLHSQLPLQRCSQFLFFQLARMPIYGGLNYPFQFVEHEIRHLEGCGNTKTKPAEPFSEKGPLRGFMHKHFFVPGYEHLGLNAKLAWKLGSATSQKLHQALLPILKPYRNRPLSETQARKVAKEVAEEFRKGLENRLAGTATGDWLIYLPHEGQNFYLCIAKHEEADFIPNAIKRCAADFSFIHKALAA